MMEDLFDRLNQSESVTVIQTGSGNFWDYDSLMNDMYRDLSGQIKINHIFSCVDLSGQVKINHIFSCVATIRS